MDGEAPGTGDPHEDSMDELQEDNDVGEESDEEENDSE